ncbi:uncharacterized protein LOC127811536 [Diospyros lotus]|uniref:uncharacterized protein LOC127811536 n=1 Tax=Diospyros lotus TaxID=55363 RepID=UPI00224E9885|nr:uncharacterized protein LOC127811536 [Diospyros lotus]
MGRRKERRLAAMIAAGRRVKLDLFAEPSGDSGGSSAQDELGGDIDLIHRAGSPNSPSSSGKQLENPLSLLGQYSDDELDDESSETLDHDTAEKSTADDNEQAKAPVGTEREDPENNASIDHNPQNDQQHDSEKHSISVDRVQNLEHNVAREIDSPVTATGDLGKELVPMEETSVPGASDVQPIDNNISNWKVVLHEESNQYYYWNTATGETSWVVPDGLVQGTDLSGEQNTAPDAEGRNIALAGEQEQKSSVDAELNSAVTMDATDYCKAGNVVHESEDICEATNETEEQSDRYKDKGLENNMQGPDANQTEVKVSSGAASVLYHKTSSLQGNVSSWESSDTFLGNGTTTGADSEKNIWNEMIHEEDDTENDLTSSVLEYSESLLERLKSLKRNNVQGHDWLSKYILEVEIRLSDIRSLLPFGSSLLPFWIHCERQLKELEGALDIEVSHYSKSAQTVEADLPRKSSESEGNEIEEDENEKGISSSAFDTSLTSADVGMLKVGQNDLKDLAADGNAPFTAHASVIDYPSSHSGSTAGKNNGVHEAAQNTELTPQAMLDAGEDVDMDVDMEVEDSAPVSATITQDSLSEKCFAPQEQPIQPHPHAELGSFVTPEAFPVPPPPEEEWIPPPPPDNELIPPPPPDDPIEPSYLPPPTYSETVPALSYTEPYNVSYPGSNFEYYGQANTQFLGNNAYPHAEGCQVAMPHPLYYEALAVTYPVAAPGVNPVEPAAYYEVQDGAVFAGPVVSGAQSSVQHSESGHDALGSDRIRSAESHIEEGYTSFSDPGVGVSVVNGSTEKTPVEVSVAPATIQAPSTISVVGNASGSSTTTGAVAPKLAVPNVQSKVSRSKKRTVAVSSTLRSNKKVSSMVDKWKAAKEELHEEEEDEPENAYESLEKKRQREIEEWRAQQIASGEAKDNANFQPLGGDWRERVKRKRAQLNNEAAHTQSGAVTDGNQQPDLTELARDLPSGWQAYWDESSKQVYYGNVITSETTWTRPVPPEW